MIERSDIHAFADGELTLDNAARIEKEIAASPEASKELEAIRALKSCLATKAEPAQAPELWKGCLNRLDEIDRAHKAESFVGKYAWALCAVLVLVILGGGFFSRMRGSSVRMGDVAAVSAGLVPIDAPRSAASEQLQNWIGDQTGQRPTIHLDPQKVVGAAYCDQPTGRVIEVHMRDSSGDTELMVIPNVSSVEGVRPMGDGLYAGQVNGVNCVTWADSGSAVVLIGPRSHEELRAIAQSLYE